jgi:hypothetical protein
MKQHPARLLVKRDLVELKGLVVELTYVAVLPGKVEISGLHRGRVVTDVLDPEQLVTVVRTAAELVTACVACALMIARGKDGCGDHVDQLVTA